MTQTFDEIKADLRQEIREYEDLLEEAYPEDIITELADSSVPIYHTDLLQLASNNWDLITTEPELGPASGSAFDGTSSPINIIAANVYEELQAVAHDELKAMKSEAENN